MKSFVLSRQALSTWALNRVLASSVFIALVLTTSNGLACTLKVDDAYAKPTIPGMSSASVYTKLTNHTTQTITIVGVSSNAAKAAELHTMSFKGERMLMRRLHEVSIEAGQSVSFTPKTDHVMLIGLHKPLVDGQTISLVFQLKNGKTVEVTVPVKSPSSESNANEKTSGDTHSHSHGEHHHHH